MTTNAETAAPSRKTAAPTLHSLHRGPQERFTEKMRNKILPYLLLLYRPIIAEIGEISDEKPPNYVNIPRMEQGGGGKDVKVAVQCDSPLLQRSLELFLEGQLSSIRQCDILIRDKDIRDDNRPTFVIGATESADLIKPFSKAQLSTPWDANSNRSTVLPRNLPPANPRPVPKKKRSASKCSNATLKN